MGRTILAVLAGAVVMWLTVFAMEFVGHALFPPPAGLDPKDPAQLQQVIAHMPVGAMAMLVLAWVLGAITGGFTAAKISRKHPRIAAAIVAVLVVLGVAGMVYLVPNHPAWVSVLGLLLPIPAALLAARWAKPTLVEA